MRPTRRRPPAPDDDDADPEDPLLSDQDDPALVDVVDCPACGAAISEYAEQCPRCGAYVVRGDAAPSKPVQRWVGGLLLMAIVLGMALALMR